MDGRRAVDIAKHRMFGPSKADVLVGLIGAVKAFELLSGRAADAERMAARFDEPALTL